MTEDTMDSGEKSINLPDMRNSLMSDSVTPYSNEYRRCVLLGICPYCGRGPFKMLAGHTYRAHAVDKRELRDKAGLNYSDSILSPEQHAKKSAKAKKDFEEGRILLTPGGTKGLKPRWSPAGKKARSEASKRAYSPEARARGAETVRDRNRQRIDDECNLVTKTYEKIVNENGRVYGAVIETARRLDMPVSVVTRRLQKTKQTSSTDGAHQ
jgi:hypothetical protein